MAVGGIKKDASAGSHPPTSQPHPKSTSNQTQNQPTTTTQTPCHALLARHYAPGIGGGCPPRLRANILTWMLGLLGVFGSPLARSLLLGTYACLYGRLDEWRGICSFGWLSGSGLAG